MLLLTKPYVRNYLTRIWVCKWRTTPKSEAPTSSGLNWRQALILQFTSSGGPGIAEQAVPIVYTRRVYTTRVYPTSPSLSAHLQADSSILGAHKSIFAIVTMRTIKVRRFLGIRVSSSSGEYGGFAPRPLLLRANALHPYIRLLKRWKDI